MSDTKNLKELHNLTQDHLRRIANNVDFGLAEYIASAIHLLEVQGKNIEEYTLIQVQNPMEVIEDGLRVTQQWRIVRIDTIQNIPTVIEDEE